MENVKVWTDSIGRWNASVPVTENRRQDATNARELIRETLAAVHYLPLDSVRKVHVVLVRVSNHGTAIYREG
jgi:hypothetical protein